MNKKYISILFLFVVCLSSYIFALEKITHFDCNISIHKDASLTVTEKISVIAEGKQIKRGLVRELPEWYKDARGYSYKTGFVVKQVLMNGKKVPFKIKHENNFKTIYIGRIDRFLQPDIYTFSITYKAPDVLGFYQEHNELYWNVTGNGWRLPIDRVTATVSLPEPVSHNTITHEAYTGYKGSKGTSYTSFIKHDGLISFETTQPLRERQGLTIVTTWPKGIVIQPDRSFDKMLDRLAMLALFILFIMLLGFYLYTYFKKCYPRHVMTVIPRFYPPTNISPGQAYYLKNQKYDYQALSVEIVDMARAGYLTIEQIKGGWFSSGTYVLHNATTNYSNVAQTIDQDLHKALHRLLFSGNTLVSLDKKDAKILERVNNYSKGYMSKTLDDSYIVFLIGTLVLGLIIIGSCSVPFIARLLFHDYKVPIFIFVISVVIITIISSYFLRFYTPEGKKAVAELDGFKMFLETTEVERIKEIGTPPTRTPELYEEYLPYAMAFGVEDRWTRQFTPMFKQMEQRGHAYHPIWYRGGSFRSFSGNYFAQNFSQSFTQALQTSGSGGQGSSGGGRGGGGGGGW